MQIFVYSKDMEKFEEFLWKILSRAYIYNLLSEKCTKMEKCVNEKQ